MVSIVKFFLKKYFYAMFTGPVEEDSFSHELRGVIPRGFEYLFSLINREKEKVKHTLSKMWSVEKENIALQVKYKVHNLQWSVFNCFGIILLKTDNG